MKIIISSFFFYQSLVFKELILGRFITLMEAMNADLG